MPNMPLESGCSKSNSDEDHLCILPSYGIIDLNNYIF